VVGSVVEIEESYSRLDRNVAGSGGYHDWNQLRVRNYMIAVDSRSA